MGLLPEKFFVVKRGCNLIPQKTAQYTEKLEIFGEFGLWLFRFRVYLRGHCDSGGGVLQICFFGSFQGGGIGVILYGFYRQFWPVCRQADNFSCIVG